MPTRCEDGNAVRGGHLEVLKWRGKDTMLF